MLNLCPLSTRMSSASTSGRSSQQTDTLILINILSSGTLQSTVTSSLSVALLWLLETIVALSVIADEEKPWHWSKARFGNNSPFRLMKQQCGDVGRFLLGTSMIEALLVELIMVVMFIFKMLIAMLNPAADFQDLSYKFVQYAQASPLALKILGSKLYKKCRKYWESEGTVEAILIGYYKGAASGINNLVDKCLLDIGYFGSISMHDMLEEMGKSIIRLESKDPRKHSRLWSPKDIYYYVNGVLSCDWNEKIHADDAVDSASRPDELRLPYGHMEHFGMKKIRTIDLICCKQLRKIPNLSRAINLEGLKFPELPNVISELDLSDMGLEEVPDSIEHQVGLKMLKLRNSKHMSFEHPSVNSSLTLKLAQNECSGSRFLAFAINLVAHLTPGNQCVVFFCNYLLRAASGTKFTGRCSIVDKNPCAYKGDHVTILFSEDLIVIDEDYDEELFEFHINNDCIMVKECGVHVFTWNGG
ncbi:hypothetical protein F3Y22_tig00110770pilonHSYRG00061 [Hibiscus syriacus]|uniref:Disease resistance protein Roq1-like winged-helix domain-containing protein n=1 Tax=Hibiscus syriacus TaxID=106335 RepID=A0A6A2ZSV1_HIBSY|nr:hypothetical protein F3Y22_tig00110770pilonHSYRG00061 [Hibiscus syriacus]